LIAGAGLGLLSAAISAPVVAALTAGATPSGLYSAIVAMARSQGVSVWGSTYVASLTTDPLDKALSFLIVSVVLIGLPKRLRQRFPGPTKLGLGGVATGARSDSDEVR
jgi:energy-coupling factor transport system substrate-specific component